MKKIFAFTILALVLSSCGQSSSLPTATQTVTPVSTPTQTITPSPTVTPLPTVTSTPEPAWYQPINESLGILKYRYGLVSSPRTHIYLTIDDAAAGNGNFSFPGDAPVYIWIGAEDSRNGKTWYATRQGWVAAEDVQLVTPSSYRGILLTRRVDFKFGWVLREVQSVNAAGTSIRTYQRYEIIHEVQPVTDHPGFFPVGPDEWLPLDAIALADDAVPPGVNPVMCRFIYVDLNTQVLRVYDGCQVVFATLISSGKEERWTGTGEFSILYKTEFTKLTQPEDAASTYALDGVPYFMTYAGDWGFHGAYWHDNFGSPASHGCINLSPADAHWLYDWAVEGDHVVIDRPAVP